LSLRRSPPFGAEQIEGASFHLLLAELGEQPDGAAGTGPYGPATIENVIVPL
jgi:hypothetical protein